MAVHAATTLATTTLASTTLAATTRAATTRFDSRQSNQQALPVTVPANLQSTLNLFNEISQRLGQSYQELEERVNLLQGELQQADQERMEQLAQKEQLADRLAVILDVLPAAVITLNGSGIVDQANRAALELLGEPLVGQRWMAVISRCFAPSPTDGHEIALKNGRLVSIATQPVGQQTGQIIVLNDLTETRRLQQQMSHHQKLSEMGRMTASLAHQIRTPLATALLYTDHLLNTKVDLQRKYRYATKLRERLLQLQSQVSDMLLFSRSGMVIRDQVSVADLLALAAGRSQEILERRGVRLQLAVENGEQLLACNLDVMVSAIGNLVDNAVQALEQAGSRDPQITLSARSSGVNEVTICVEDNGPGVPDAYLQQIFEPFFTTKSTGTGLGLAVVKAVAQAHHAQLRVTRSVQGGACFEIQFPVTAAAVTTLSMNGRRAALQEVTHAQ
jgi:two-component system sensor histidine kinase FlrB